MFWTIVFGVGFGLYLGEMLVAFTKLGLELYEKNQRKKQFQKWFGSSYAKPEPVKNVLEDIGFELGAGQLPDNFGK